ncbi:hypothetical protein IG631_07792 [Alternaria alternata]|nr:hypothetical protein IG631_07792 [Alternaria alternata]
MAMNAANQSRDFMLHQRPFDTAWPKVLQEMRKSLSLDHATVTGKLGENRHMRGWRLHEKHDELAAAVSDYLVRGGQCPLTADNADFDPESDTDSKREGSAA